MRVAVLSGGRSSEHEISLASGAAVREVKVEQDQVGIMLFGRGDCAIRILGDGHDAIARIVLDQIFQRRRQLRVVFDDENSKHWRASPVQPLENPPGNSVS